MSQDDQIRWNRQHAESGGSEEPSRFLREVLESESWDLPPGRALDLACGKGRNALYLASRGFHVTAVDISPVALERGRRLCEQRLLAVEWQQADLEHLQLKTAEYDLIVNINYLQRSLIENIKTALKTTGHVIFETYLIDQQIIGHPKNPAYLLAHNELLEYFRDFRVLSYREGKFPDAGKPSYRAGIFARKSAQ
ncbi:MAG TPA: class I SAM-dependent methyltransferase [Candidatus Binatia bacterium]|jgi:SAM-dependent methyltransferase